MADACESKLAVDEPRDGVTSIVAKQLAVSAAEVVEDAGGEVTGGRGFGMSVAQRMESAAGPGETESLAVAEERALEREPLHSEQVEGVAEPANGVGEVGAADVARVEFVAMKLRVEDAGGVAGGASRAMLCEGGADEGGEVAIDGADVGGIVEEEPLSQGGLGAAEDVERVAPEAVDEARAGCMEEEEAMKMGEEEARAAVVGASDLARAGRGADERVLGRPAASIAGAAGGARAGLVGAQDGGDGEAREGDGESGRAQRRDELGEAAREREQGLQDPLERVEALLDSGLAGGVALLLRRVLGVERVERSARLSGHVGRSLVGDGLDAGASTTWPADSLVSMTTASKSR